MEQLSQLSVQQFLLFTLVLSRFSGLMMTAPIYGTRDIPMKIRALLAIGLALIITPSQISATPDYPASLGAYGLMLGAELLVGVLLGMGVGILFSGVEMAGQLIAQVSGLSLAEVINPSQGTSVPIFSELLRYCTLAAFVLVGGHREVMEGLLETFSVLPPGQANLIGTLDQYCLLLAGESFELAIRTAAPTLLAQLLATVVLGLISRTLPQLNILALGFGVNAMVTFGMLSLSLGGIVWTFQDKFDPYLTSLLELVTGAS